MALKSTPRAAHGPTLVSLLPWNSPSQTRVFPATLGVTSLGHGLTPP